MSRKHGQYAAAGDEEREESGRYRIGFPCDCCGWSSGYPANFTDYDVCESSDGPGFLLCGRDACGKKYEGKTVEERRAIFTAGRARNVARQEARDARKAAAIYRAGGDL